MRFSKGLQLFSVCMFLMGMVMFVPQQAKAATAAAGQSCGFNTIGDWVCPQATGAAGSTGGASLSGGGNPFTAGGPLFNGSLPGGSTTLGALSGMFDSLAPGLQACATQMIAGTDLNNLSLADILNLISNIMSLQGGLDSIPDTITCPDGRSIPNPGIAYMQQAYVNQVCSSTGSSLTAGGNPFSAFSSTLASDTTNASCNGESPNATPTANSTGSPALPPGTHAATGDCAPVNNATITDDIYAELEREEGVRNCAYTDSVGKWTIGVGHLIIPGDGMNSSTCLSDAEVRTLTENDMASRDPTVNAILSEMGVNTHEFKVAMFSVVWQMGDIRSRFPSLWAKLTAGDYTGACTMIKGWKWHKQTPRRTNNFCTALHNLANCITPGSAPAGQIEPMDLTEDSGYRGETPPDCMTGGSVNNWDQSKSDIAFDNLLGTTGNCALGVRTILSNIPGSGVSGGLGNAYEYQTSLPGIGYTLYPVASAETAPVGCILVYDRNSPPGGSGGAKYGHVEIVVTKQDGTRGYISDYFSTNPGGSRPAADHLVGCYSNSGGPEGGDTTQMACSSQAGGAQGGDYTPVGAQAGGGASGPFGGLGGGPLGSFTSATGGLFAGGSSLLSGGMLNPSAFTNLNLSSLTSTAISGFQSALQTQLTGIVSDLQEMTNIQNLMADIGMDQIMQFADNLGANFFEQITTFDPQVFLESQLNGIMQDAQDILGQANTILDGIQGNIESVIQGGIESIMGPINSTIQDTLNNTIINQIDLNLQKLVTDQIQLDIIPNLDSIISAGGLTTAIQDNITNAVQTQAQAMIDSVVNSTITDLQNALPGNMSVADINNLVTQVQTAINGDLTNQIQTQILSSVDSQITSAISGFTPPSGDNFRVETFMGQVISAERYIDTGFGGYWQDMNITIP